VECRIEAARRPRVDLLDGHPALRAQVGGRRGALCGDDRGDAPRVRTMRFAERAIETVTRARDIDHAAYRGNLRGIAAHQGISSRQARLRQPGVLEFVLEPANAQLRCGSKAVALRPKAFATLQYLAERSGRLVTKAELSRFRPGRRIARLARDTGRELCPDRTRCRGRAACDGRPRSP